MSGHWCCGEPMIVVATRLDPTMMREVDVLECTCCGRRDTDD